MCWTIYIVFRLPVELRLEVRIDSRYGIKPVKTSKPIKKKRKLSWKTLRGQYISETSALGDGYTHQKLSFLFPSTASTYTHTRTHQHRWQWDLIDSEPGQWWHNLKFRTYQRPTNRIYFYPNSIFRYVISLAFVVCLLHRLRFDFNINSKQWQWNMRQISYLVYRFI